VALKESFLIVNSGNAIFTNMIDQNHPAQAPSSLAPTGTFDARSAQPFIVKSLSAETRRAYAAAIRDFFRFVGHIHPLAVTPGHVIAYRDRLMSGGRRPRTVVARLAVVRSFLSYLVEAGQLPRNPASAKLVPPPKVPASAAGRALSKKEVLHILTAPDRRTPAGARDHALMLLMARLSLRLSEVCALKVSSISPGTAGWILECKVKGGREERWPLPQDVKERLDEYLRLDAPRRIALGTDGPGAWLFQPHKNHRTLVHNKPLSQRQVQKIVARWADYARVGKVTPHDFRRTAITEMLKIYPIQEVQMASKHRDVRTLMGYDRDRENLERNPVNTFRYD
jgi:integrase/recombinase XerD